LREIDLTLQAGEFVAIVGTNGSGKTTLARHFNALLLPTQGRVQVAGLDTRQESNHGDIRSQVSMIFQRPEDQIVATTVEDDVAFGPENLGLSSKEIGRRVSWALETVQAQALRQRPPHLLSAGQQQRVAIAGALAMHPRCLILDEATAMLDPSGRREVLALARQLWEEGMTIVMITHFMHEAALAERVIALDRGRIAFDGPPRQLFTDLERLAALGLEPPPAAALATEAGRLWPDFSSHLLTRDELVEALLPRLPRNGAPSKARPEPQTLCKGPPLISVNDLHHTYLEGTPLATAALKGIGLEVQTGEVLALLGPTGSGKSTLLQHIAGLLERQGGDVQMADTEAPDLPAAANSGRHPVGMLFQRPEEQLFETYLGDDVAFGPRQLGLSQDAVRERVRWAMGTAGLPFKAYKDRFTQSLSGGEKRKAALAGVLALRPHVLLLDEPTAGLDPQARQSLIQILKQLNQEAGMTLIIASHTMEDVATLADRILVLDGGRIVTHGTPRQLFSQPELLAAHGLDVPEITALMHRLRAAGACVPADVLTVAEAVTVLKGEPECYTI
jgi:energy-coupling factor transport system ATP-binding protein